MPPTIISLKVFTPRGAVMMADSHAVKLPGIDGEFEVLPGHAQLIALLGTGIMSFTPTVSGAATKAVISGGFASFKDGVLTVLADTIDLPEENQAAALTKEKAELERIVHDVSSYEPQWLVAKNKLERLAAISQLN